MHRNVAIRSVRQHPCFAFPNSRAPEEADISNSSAAACCILSLRQKGTWLNQREARGVMANNFMKVLMMGQEVHTVSFETTRKGPFQLLDTTSHISMAIDTKKHRVALVAEIRS